MNMTYKELKEKNDKLERQANLCHARQRKNCEDYKRQNAPFPLRKNQRITVTMRVTEKTRKRLSQKDLKLKKWQLGNVYSATGCIRDWYINEDMDGILYPCFFRGEEFSYLDEMIDIKIADKQFEGSCEQCRRYKDGLCFLAGGMTISNKLATGKAGEFTCPIYEEKTELWSKYGQLYHYPNVTYLRNADKPSYYVYALNWDTYTEYKADEIERYFSLTKPES